MYKDLAETNRQTLRFIVRNKDQIDSAYPPPSADLTFNQEGAYNEGRQTFHGQTEKQTYHLSIQSSTCPLLPSAVSQSAS